VSDVGDPVTAVAGIGLGLDIVGGLFSANAQKEAGNAQAATYFEQARAADLNAAAAGELSRDAVIRGGLEERNLRQQGGQLLGSQKAAYGASGIDSATGSAAQVADASRLALEEDVAAIRLNAQREAWGSQIDALNYKSQARAYRNAAKAAKKSGGQAGMGTMLTTASSVASKWSSLAG
jgi:hypothetical protein